MQNKTALTAILTGVIGVVYYVASVSFLDRLLAHLTIAGGLANYFSILVKWGLPAVIGLIVSLYLQKHFSKKGEEEIAMGIRYGLILCVILFLADRCVYTLHCLGQFNSGQLC